jgi:hypothetical protein
VNEEIEVTKRSCAVKCFPYVYVSITYAACVASCATSSTDGVDEMPQQPEVFPDAAVAETESCDVKECIQKCGVFVPLDPALYMICRNDCQKDDSNGGRELNCKPDEKAVEMDPECVKSCSIHELVRPLHKKCLVGCQESGKMGKLAFSTRRPILPITASVQPIIPGQFLLSYCYF